MTNLEDTVKRAATGEMRLNPDEQRNYLGTFEERVVLSILLDDACSEDVKNHFETVLSLLKEQYDKLFIKISPDLSVGNQMYYMKIGQGSHLQVTIVNEACLNSPFGIIIHSNKAESVKDSDIKVVFPDFFKTKQDIKEKKKSFWSHLF